MRPDRVRDGLRLALTTLTVAPVRAGRVDRATAAVAMSVAPIVGAVLGAFLYDIFVNKHHAAPEAGR